MGWTKGHSGRTDGPLAAQDWCDRAATEADRALASGLEVDDQEDMCASRYDTPFLLIDGESRKPIWGGWKSEITKRARERLKDKVMGDEKSECSRWLRIRERWCSRTTEWDRLPLKGRHGPAARGRINAQWDTVYGPGRWEEEQRARDEETLQALERPCRG